MATSESEDQEPVIHLTISMEHEAEEEIAEAYQYYEDKAEGLGMEFLRAVEACLSSIERNPRMYAVLHKEVRRGLLRRFPYGLLYFIKDDSIVVIACFHASRDPRQWQRRV